MKEVSQIGVSLAIGSDLSRQLARTRGEVSKLEAASTNGGLPVWKLRQIAREVLAPVAPQMNAGYAKASATSGVALEGQAADYSESSQTTTAVSKEGGFHVPSVKPDRAGGLPMPTRFRLRGDVRTLETVRGSDALSSSPTPFFSPQSILGPDLVAKSQSGHAFDRASSGKAATQTRWSDRRPVQSRSAVAVSPPGSATLADFARTHAGNQSAIFGSVIDSLPGANCLKSVPALTPALVGLQATSPSAAPRSSARHVASDQATGATLSGANTAAGNGPGVRSADDVQSASERSSNDGDNGGSDLKQIQGDVYLDGSLVGQWISNLLSRQAGRSSVGRTGFDVRRGRLLPGPTVGGQ